MITLLNKRVAHINLVQRDDTSKIDLLEGFAVLVIYLQASMGTHLQNGTNSNASPDCDGCSGLYPMSDCKCPLLATLRLFGVLHVYLRTAVDCMLLVGTMHGWVAPHVCPSWCTYHIMTTCMHTVDAVSGLKLIV